MDVQVKVIEFSFRVILDGELYKHCIKAIPYQYKCTTLEKKKVKTVQVNVYVKEQ